MLSRVRLFATPWTAARQASLIINYPQSSLKLMSIKPVMPSSHFILCRPLLLLPPIPPNIRVFSNESNLRMRWPKYWSFSFSISPSNEHSGQTSIVVKVKGLSAWVHNSRIKPYDLQEGETVTETPKPEGNPSCEPAETSDSCSGRAPSHVPQISKMPPMMFLCFLIMSPCKVLKSP